MKSRQLVASALVLLALMVSTAWADGLIFQLPPDGTWATFDSKTEGEFTLPDHPAQKIQSTGTVTVSSVGKIVYCDQPCRWIEMRVNNEGQYEGMYKKLVLKLLVPEEFLIRGQDPLAHSVKTFFDPKGVDQKAGRIESFIEKGVNRVQYEIDRFRVVFPKPLDNMHSLPRETVKIGDKEWRDCEVIEGDSHYDGPMVDDTRAVVDGKYRITLNPAAPFGVVALQIDSTSKEHARSSIVTGKATQTLSLSKWGTDAVSELTQGSVQTANSDESSGKKAQAADQKKASAEGGAADRPADAEQRAVISELEKVFHAGDVVGFRKLALFADEKSPAPTAKNMAANVEKHVFNDSRLEPLDSKSQGPVVAVITRFNIRNSTLRPAFYFVKRDDQWRVVFDIASLPKEEKDAADELKKWAEDWRKTHPDEDRPPANQNAK